MNSEQKVVKDFFDKFGNYNTTTIAMSGMLIVICFVFQFFVAIAGFDTMIRTTILYNEDYSVTFGAALFVGPIMGFLRILPYQTFNMNQKSKAVSEILKYHPIDKKAIRNMKIEKLAKFMFKVTIVSMVIQVLRCIFKGYEISWFNLLYIFVLSFVWPLVVNVIPIWLENKE